MGIYEITARRANGATFTDSIYATSERAARRDFEEIYRHCDGREIISVKKKKELPVAPPQNYHGEL